MGKKSAKQVTNFLGTSALTRPLFALGAASMLFGSGSAYATDPGALPQNPNVVGGKDSFSQSGNTLNVNQSTNRTVIDWRSFDIGSKAQVNFAQPGKSSIAVNRINGSTNPTDIEGGLHANGQVWILNPNGVFFGKGARVDAAGIVATTANINDKAFMAGSNKLQMTGADHGSVENQGNISVGANGLAAFVAPSVRNSGTINATVGRVALAAGTTYTLDLAGDHLVELGLGSVKAVVDNSGKIVNPGGTIALTAKAAGQVVNSVVNVSGVVSASSVSKSGGTITLGADTVNTTSTAQLSADAGTSGNGGTITSVANVQGNYAGAFSAKGGSTSGDGGKVETSGKSVTITDGISVDTRATNGILGNWTVDPIDIAIVSGSGGDTVGAGGSITEGAIESALNTTSLTISTDQGTGGNGDISLQTAINSTGPGSLTLVGRHLSAASGADTITLAGALTLDVNYVNTSATGGTWINDALGMVGSVAGGTTINLGAGTYSAGVSVNKANVTINGHNHAEISVGTGQTGVTIGTSANNVTIENLEIAGPIVADYENVNWGTAGSSTGIVVAGTTSTGSSGFNIKNNDIHDIRTGIIVQGQSASGSITGNTVENTKGGILIQYNDGSPYTITGNSEGSVGNEWGIVLNLNTAGHVATAEPGADQAKLLLLSQNNGGLGVLDRFYGSANRTEVTVDAASTATAADDAVGYNGNGLGSARQPISTIQSGIDAVVAGGTVNVLNGTYTISSGYISIGKSLNLIGQSEAGVIIDARYASSYGLRIIGGTDGVTLENFTLWGVTAAGGYGVKAEDTTNLDIEHVTSKGAYKAQFDLNGVRGGEVNYVTADGNGVSGGAGSTKGAAIAITDSQDILVENSNIIGGSYGGIGIYQSNKPSGYSYQANNITIADTNTFDENGAAHYNYVYTEDESATHDFGTLTIDGFDTVAGVDSNPADTFKFFQHSVGDAEAYLNATGGISVGYVEGWTGSTGDNNFSVDTVGGNAMSIQAAINAAAAGATINVGAGTYTDALNIGKNVDIEGAGSGSTIIQPTALLTTGVGHKYDSNVKTAVYVHDANDVTINGVTIDANNLGANAVVFWNNASGTISNSLIENPMVFSGAQTGQDLAVDATAGNTTDLTVSNVTFQNWNKNAIDAVTGDGAGANGGEIVLNVSDSTFTGAGDTGTIAQNGILLWEQGGGSVSATVDNSSFSDLSYNDPNTATATGVLVYGSANGTVTVSNSDFDSSVQEYISTAGGSPNEVDATNGNTFGGVATNSATLDQIFAIVDKITDGTDDSSNGLVRLVAGQVYATAAKDNIQNAVDVASNGDAVNIQAGTYNQGVTINKNVSLVGESSADRADITGGILMTGSLSDITLKNLDVSGTVSGLNADFVIKDSGTLNNFTMDHVKVDGESVAGRFGVGNGQISGAISITNSEFDNISGWVVFDNRAGAGGTPGVNDGTLLTSVNFSNNVIDNSQGSIAFRQLGNGGPYADVTISDNVVENVGDAVNSFGGIFKVFNAGTVTFSGNNISDIGTSGFNPAGEAAYGAALLTRGVNTLNVTNNTFTDNNMAFAVEPGKALAGTVNFTGNTFDNNKYAIYLPTNVSGSGTINFGAGNNFIDGANTVKDIVWTSASDLNLTNVKFNGLLGSQMTLDQLFAVEDLITDGLDNTAYGLARINAGNVYVTAASGSITNGVTKASAGDTVNVQNGSYTLAGELDITKSLTLKGQSQNGTIIASNSTGYGINVTADNVSLQNFTFHGPTATGSTYGIKVTPDTNVASDRLLNFDIENVTIDRGYRTGLDLNGVDGATIKNVSVSNIVHGNGIALTDSANVTITGSTTTNNAWGGLALYQTNAFYDQQLNNIVVDGTNTFNEADGVYEEDQSASLDMGSLTLAGYGFAAIDKSVANDQYTFFQKTEQGALDFATNATLNSGHLTLANTYVEGWSGTGLNGAFYVGTGANGSQLLIATAVGAASTGNTINVDAGTYAEDVTVAKQLEFDFGGSTVNSFTLASGGAGSTLNGDLTATGAIALNGDATVAGDLTAASFTSNGTLAMTGDLTTSGAAALNGASSITGDVTADSFTSGSTLTLVGDLTATNGVTFGGASTVNGNVQAGAITASDAFALTGNATASGAIALNGANTLSGNLTGGSIALGATTLAGNTALDTSAANGAITVASVNGTTAGGQSLAINAGTGAVSLGDLGATTRLGAVSDASKTTLTGSTYNANSFLFGGDVTLASASTTLNTTQSSGAAGDITFKGDIFGTKDGAQSLTLIAGSGKGAASANGDITLQNAGSSSVELGDMTVSGNNFTALTVWLAGNYASTLTGNQVFAADTLHTGGNVNSNVGGDASGHIESQGDVNIAAKGDVSGTIGGNNVTLSGDDVNSTVTAANNASVNGNTVEGSYTGDNVSIVAADNVDAAVNATNFALVAPAGSVDGTWANYDVSGSGTVYLNGDPQIGVNPSQLVVEGFVLPAGTTIGPNGQLILPQGVLLGLLSPGGGKPKMILVHSVQELGQLLASGYSVIVIDLSTRGSNKPVQLASN